MNALRVNHRRWRRQPGERGVVLLEVLISILIFSLGIVGLLGIQALSVQNIREANMRADAVFATNEMLGRMWVNRTNLASYAKTYTSATEPSLSTLPGGSMTVTVNVPVVTVTVNWTPPGASAARQFATDATITGN